MNSFIPIPARLPHKSLATEPLPSYYHLMYSFTPCAAGCGKLSLTGAKTCARHAADPQSETLRITRLIQEGAEAKDLNGGGLYFEDVDFSNRRFFGCSFSGAHFKNCRFTKAFIRLSFFDFCEFSNCDLSGMDTQFSDFAGAIISGCTFEGSELIHINFCGAEISDSSFNNSDLYNSRFISAKLTNTTIIDCNIKKTFFIKSTQNEVCFKSSNTAEAIFELEAQP